MLGLGVLDDIHFWVADELIDRQTAGRISDIWNATSATELDFASFDRSYRPRSRYRSPSKRLMTNIALFRHVPAVIAPIQQVTAILPNPGQYHYGTCRFDVSADDTVVLSCRFPEELHDISRSQDSHAVPYETKPLL